MPIPRRPRPICSRPFGEDGLNIVREIIGEGGKEGIPRSEIARRVCIALEWHNARGGLKQMGVRVALIRQGWIRLRAGDSTRRRRGDAEWPGGCRT